MLLIFFIFWEDFWKKKKDEYAIGPSAIAFLLIVLGHIDYEYSFHIQISLFILSLMAYFILRKRKFIYATIPRIRFFSILGILIYLFGIFYYAKNGKKDALNFYNNHEKNIAITVSNGNIIYGKFITFMNGKFFLITEDLKRNKQILAIEESQMITAEIIKKSEAGSKD